MDLDTRLQVAMQAATEAGALALDHYARRGTLTIESKGRQDWVSEADRNVETALRAALAAALPDDAIVGEEHPPRPGSSGFTWVIDPIDGTTNFLAGIPFWCVAIAGIAQGRRKVAVIHDPLHAETFTAISGGGAALNGAPISVSAAPLSEGTVCIGSSRRSPPAEVAALVRGLLDAGAFFARTGSGALGLAHVAAGRYLGYTENYMNAWDCLAGQLLIAEAGGLIEDSDADRFIADGGRVVTGTPATFAPIRQITDAAFGA